MSDSLMFDLLVGSFTLSRTRKCILFSYDGEVKKSSDFLYVPGVNENLLSSGGITDQGCLVVF